MTTVITDATRPAPAAGRGRLVLEHQVIEKIAGQAAAEVATGRAGRAFLRGRSSGRPKAEVELFGRTATIELTVAIAYPTPIREATEQVRRHVVDRVAELTGVEVTRVDITVSALDLGTTTTEALR